MRIGIGELAVYDILSAVVGEGYRELLWAVAPVAMVFGLVDHAGTCLRETGREVMGRLGEHLFDADEVQAGPGSLICGDGVPVQA